MSLSTWSTVFHQIGVFLWFVLGLFVLFSLIEGEPTVLSLAIGLFTLAAALGAAAVSLLIQGLEGIIPSTSNVHSTLEREAL